MLAHRMEGNVADQDQLVGARMELRTQVLSRVLGQTGAHFAPRASHAIGGADQAFAFGILADSDQQVTRRLLHGCSIVGHACSSELLADASKASEVASAEFRPTGLPRRAPGTAASD